MTDRNIGTSYELAADNSMIRGYTDGLVQERRNSIALVMIPLPTKLHQIEINIIE